MTPEEHAELRKAIDENGNIRVRVLGRPRKDPEEKQNPSGIRLSAKQREAFKKEALKAGFGSWQTWLKDLGEKAAGLKEAN